MGIGYGTATTAPADTGNDALFDTRSTLCAKEMETASDNNSNGSNQSIDLVHRYSDSKNSLNITTGKLKSTLEVVSLVPNQRLQNFEHNYEVDDNVEPISICIGYIFASKKMNTMSVVMAEASKVRLGMLCTASVDSSLVTEATFCNRDISSESNNSATTTSSSTDEVTFSMENVNRRYNHCQFTLTQARLLTHQGASTGSHTLTYMDFHRPPQGYNNNTIIYGTRKAKKSLYNGSSISTPTSSSQQHPSLSPSSQSSVTTNSTRSYQTLQHRPTSPNTNTKEASNINDLARVVSRNSTKMKNPPMIPSSVSTFTNTPNKMVKHVVVPIRISFVPLDDSIPFIEQHSGKIDIILHKLTEDIVNASQHMITHQSHAVSSKWAQDCNVYSSNEGRDTSQQPPDSTLLPYSAISSSDIQLQHLSMERIQRLLDYDEQQQHSKSFDQTFSSPLPYDPVGCLIDHPMAVRKVMCRAEIAMTLQQCLQNVETKSGIPVRTPKYAILRHEEQPENANIHQLGKTSNSQLQQLLLDLAFPIIVKPLVAAGTKSSHAMTIIMENNDCQCPLDHVRRTATIDAPDIEVNAPTNTSVETSRLHELRNILRDKYPAICQEYSNHDAKLYKVYVLGDYVSVHQRRSLPNLPTTRSMSIEADSNGDRPKSLRNKQNPSKYSSVEFDSQRPYPHLSDFGYTVGDHEDDHENYCTQKNGDVKTSEVQVTVDEVRPIVKALKGAFHLELFGFDILITNVATTEPSTHASANPENHAVNKMMLVVDVNYFPSYKELTNFPTLLAQYLAQRAVVRRQQQ